MLAWLMGTSVTKSQAQLKAEAGFSKVELASLGRQFHAISKNEMSMDDFLNKLCDLPDDGINKLGKVLWLAMSQGRDSVHLADVIVAKAKMERLGKEEALSLTFRILQGLDESNQGEELSSDAVRRGLNACVSLSTGYIDSDEVEHVLAEMSQLSQLSTGSISLDQYIRFHKSFPALHDALSSLLSKVEPASDSHWSRGLKLSTNGPGVKSLLQPLDAWLLASCLPPDLTQEWTLIFNSDKDGVSFNTMMGRLGRCIAPSLIVIRDKGGFIFGGFAPTPWVKSGTHFGDASSFVFGLKPKLSLCRATGMNSNYLWCGMGFTQLSNGIGFGGSQGAHLGHFSVFVDSNLEKGMSRPISTFGNDCLASSQVFEIDSIECWQLKPNEEEPASQRRGGGGALSEKNAVDRAFLANAGVQVNHSAGLSHEPVE